jgi:hypothetical protein
LYSGIETRLSPTLVDFVNVVMDDDGAGETFWRNLLDGSKMTQIIPQKKPSYNNVVNKMVTKTVGLPALQSYGITTASLVLST